MGVVELAWLGLRARPLASLLSVVALALALASASTLLTAQRALDEGFSRVDPAVDVVVGPKQSPWRIFHGAMQHGPWCCDFVRGSTAMSAIEHGESLRHVMPIARFAHVDGVAVLGVEDSFIDRPEGLFAPHVETGRWLGADHELVLGAGAARRLRLSVGDEVYLRSDLSEDGSSAPVWSGRAHIVGVFARTFTFLDDAAYAPVARARTAYRPMIEQMPYRHYTSDLYTHLLISIHPDVPAQRAELFETFHTRRAEQVVMIDELLADWRELTGATRAFGTGTTAALLLIAAMLLLFVFQERAEVARPREGLMRALGYARLQHAAVSTLHMTSLLALAIPIALAGERVVLHTLSLVVSPLGAGITRLPVVTSHHIILWSLAFGFVLALGLVSMWRREDPGLLKGL